MTNWAIKWSARSIRSPQALPIYLTCVAECAWIAIGVLLFKPWTVKYIGLSTSLTAVSAISKTKGSALDLHL